MNPNNCAACDYSKYEHEGGHCYMFRHEPEGVCMQHTARRVGTIGHIGGRSSPVAVLASILAQQTRTNNNEDRS